MIYATTGHIGSGKDTAVEILGEFFEAEKLNISDLVRGLAGQRGVSIEREPLTRFTQEVQAEQGPEYFINMAIEQIKKMNTPVILVSGIRSPENVEVMRKAFPKDFILIAVEVTQENRFERIRKRASEKDDVSYTEFLQHDAEQERIFGISKAMKLADYHIDNNGSRDDLMAVLKKISYNI